jgi:hypothetical protein
MSAHGLTFLDAGACAIPLAAISYMKDVALNLEPWYKLFFARLSNITQLHHKGIASSHAFPIHTWLTIIRCVNQIASEVKARNDFLVVHTVEYIILACKILAFSLTWKIVLEVKEIWLSREICWDLMVGALTADIASLIRVVSSCSFWAVLLPLGRSWLSRLYSTSRNVILTWRLRSI